MRIVVALGGNALLERGETPDAEIQQRHVERAADALAPLCRDHEVVITHGNGPQVGVLALESDSDHALSHGYPLDVIGAETQGMIGYWLLQSLENAVPEKKFVSLVCQTVVSEQDPSFADPSKFVGEVYSEAEAKRLAAERGWQIRADGKAWRRVVPSPLPSELVELPVIQELLDEGVVAICAGGGGIPVVRGADGRLHGIEAVIDKDRTAALLAEHVGADALVLLTDVAAVEIGYGTPDARPIRRTTPAELRSISFPAGSMGPKIEAVCSFVSATDGFAGIGRLGDALAILTGDAGTRIEAVRSDK
jgi:carbamate kinase